jgi:hypothetical protein
MFAFREQKVKPYETNDERFLMDIRLQANEQAAPHVQR